MDQERKDLSRVLMRVRDEYMIKIVEQGRIGFLDGKDCPYHTIPHCAMFWRMGWEYQAQAREYSQGRV